MKFYVILENAPDCELSRATCEFESAGMDENDVGDKVDDLATGVIEGWVLSIGDTIKIVGDE